jgi:2-oxoglutarate ferredoxin oxidoreductase subunit gamma
MEREAILIGIGGQGVQLAANVLARGAMLEGRQVSVISVYGGEMRGGKTVTTVVFGDGPIESPPLVSRAWSAVELHPRYWTEAADKISDKGFVLYNQDLCGAEHEGKSYRKIPLAATQLAKELGSDALAAMVLAAAYAKLTGVVGLESAKQAMRELVPPYRKQRIAENERALDAGFGAIEPLADGFKPLVRKEAA